MVTTQALVSFKKYMPPSSSLLQGKHAPLQQNMCSVCLHEKLENVEWEFTSIGITIEENNISG
jgi:hypothetical protein